MIVRLGCFLCCSCWIAAIGQENWTIQKLVAVDYPPLAQQARIQGVVELACNVGSDGLVVGCRGASGHPLLRQVAVENAKKWLFRRKGTSDDDEKQLLLRYEFVLLEDRPVRGRPKVEFSFEFPNRVRIASEVPCPDHLPCTPEESEKNQKQEPKKTKRIIP